MSEEDIVSRADATDARMGDDAEGMIRSLVRGLDHQRRVSRWLALSIVLDIAMTFMVVFFFTRGVEQGVQIDRNSAAVAQARVTQRASCLSGNEFRENERLLWDRILSLPPAPGRTPEQVAASVKTTASINSFLDVAFKLRVCK